ncbi:hypothetical protein B0H16DRAFT_1687254 [Mycena metata]|uniref:Uncharacterized protein n=1 Tax=Mycena metata TaxID=1033252 RepID=A0AAD7JIM0_9AGAR|nr:hypothetical protein B0H16DRAFT_1687254 [Mycena metata]
MSLEEKIGVEEASTWKIRVIGEDDTDDASSTHSQVLTCGSVFGLMRTRGEEGEERNSKLKVISVDDAFRRKEVSIRIKEKIDRRMEDRRRIKEKAEEGSAEMSLLPAVEVQSHPDSKAIEFEEKIHRVRTGTGKSGQARTSMQSRRACTRSAGPGLSKSAEVSSVLRMIHMGRVTGIPIPIPSLRRVAGGRRREKPRAPIHEEIAADSRSERGAFEVFPWTSGFPDILNPRPNQFRIGMENRGLSNLKIQLGNRCVESGGGCRAMKPGRIGRREPRESSTDAGKGGSPLSAAAASPARVCIGRGAPQYIGMQWESHRPARSSAAVACPHPPRRSSAHLSEVRPRLGEKADGSGFGGGRRRGTSRRILKHVRVARAGRKKRCVDSSQIRAPSLRRFELRVRGLPGAWTGVTVQARALAGSGSQTGGRVSREREQSTAPSSRAQIRYLIHKTLVVGNSESESSGVACRPAPVVGGHRRRAEHSVDLRRRPSRWGVPIPIESRLGSRRTAVSYICIEDPALVATHLCRPSTECSNPAPVVLVSCRPETRLDDAPTPLKRGGVKPDLIPQRIVGSSWPWVVRPLRLTFPPCWQVDIGRGGACRQALEPEDPGVALVVSLVATPSAVLFTSPTRDVARIQVSEDPSLPRLLSNPETASVILSSSESLAGASKARLQPLLVVATVRILVLPLVVRTCPRGVVQAAQYSQSYATVTIFGVERTRRAGNGAVTEVNEATGGANDLLIQGGAARAEHDVRGNETVRDESTSRFAFSKYTINLVAQSVSKPKPKAQAQAARAALARNNALAQPTRHVSPPPTFALVPVHAPAPSTGPCVRRGGAEARARAADGVDAVEQGAREEAGPRVGGGVVPRVEGRRGKWDGGFLRLRSSSGRRGGEEGRGVPAEKEGERRRPGVGVGAGTTMVSRVREGGVFWFGMGSGAASSAKGSKRLVGRGCGCSGEWLVVARLRRRRGFRGWLLDEVDAYEDDKSKLSPVHDGVGLV